MITMALLLWGSVLQAQDQQVPMDRDSSVYTIDAGLQSKLQLEEFEEYPGFRQANLYLLQDGSYELVVEYQRDGRNVRDRKKLGVAEVELLRAHVTGQMQRNDVRIGLNQQGRQGLLIRTGLLGMVEGSFIAGAAGMNVQGHLAMPLLGGSLGYFAPLFATQNQEVSKATAKLTGYGGLQGILHGAALSAMVGTGLESRGTLTLLSLTTAVEAYAGYYIGQSYNWDSGRARVIKYSGLTGNLYGVGLANLVAGDDISSELMGASAILGSAGGAWAGYRLSGNNRYSDGDAHLYLTSGILGTQIMANVPIMAESEDARLVSGTLITGSALGFYLAHRLAGTYRLDNSEARIVRLGYGAGYLLGGGLNVLASSDARTSWAVGTLASVAGYAIGLSSVLNRDNREGRTNAFLKEVQVMPDIYAGRETQLINSFYKRGGNSAEKSVSYLSQRGLSRDITPMIKFRIGF